MDYSTLPNEPTNSNPSPPSISSWLFLTPETGSTSHLEGPADAITQAERLGTGYRGRSHASSVASTFMIHRLYDTDNDDNGENPFEPEYSGCPSRTYPSSCGSNDDDTSPNNSPCKDGRFVDATIHPVTPANAPVSVATLRSTRQPALPPIDTSMSSDSSSLFHMGSGSSTEPAPWQFGVIYSSPNSKPRRNGEDQPNAQREHAALLEKQVELYGPVRDVDKELFINTSFKAKLRQFFHSKVSKGLDFAKRFRNLWK